MPPEPIGPTTSYGPRRLPQARAIWDGHYPSKSAHYVQWRCSSGASVDVEYDQRPRRSDNMSTRRSVETIFAVSLLMGASGAVLTTAGPGPRRASSRHLAPRSVIAFVSTRDDP